MNVNQPSAFNFNLTFGSPGLHAGTQLGAPLFDNIGRAFNVLTPSIGALELALRISDIMGGKLTFSGKVVLQ